MKINILKKTMCCILTLSLAVPALCVYGDQEVESYNFDEIVSGSALEMTEENNDPIVEMPIYTNEDVIRNLYTGNSYENRTGTNFLAPINATLYRDALNSEERKVYDYLVDYAKAENIKYNSFNYTTSEGSKTYSGNLISIAASAEEIGYDINYDDNSWTSIANIVNAFLNDHTDLGWIGAAFYGYNYNSNTQKIRNVSILFVTIGDSQTAIDNNEQYLKWCDNIAEEAEKNTTDYYRVKYIHDVVLDNATYDYYAAFEAEMYSEEFLYAHSPYGICMKGKAVCEGYAEAFKTICNRAGIDVVCQSGYSANGGHEWNQVKMNNNKWYYVDTTWDDGGSYNYYKFFLNGSESFKANHSEFYYSNKLNLDIDSNDFSSSDASPFETTKSTTVNIESNSETTTAVYDNFVYTLKNGNATIIGYTGSTKGTGNFIIPAYVNGIKVTEIGESAFEYLNFSNQNIIISDGIEVLCSRAFWGVTANKIEVPESVKLLDYTAISYDGEEVHGTDSLWAYVFSYANIKEISVDSNNKYFCSIDGVFYNKDKSALLNYPRLKTNTVYKLPEETATIACTAFGRANNLKKVYIYNDNAHFSTFTFAYCSLEIYGTEANRAQLEKNISTSNSNSNSVLTFKLISEDNSIIYGDVNSDGAVNGIDLLRLAKYFAGWEVLISSDASDVNADGTLNGLDLLRLAKYFAGWDVQLGE